MKITTNHGFIIKEHPFACTHSSSCPCEVVEDEESLTPHSGCFGGDNVCDFAIGGEESKELAAKLVLVYLVVEIVDIKGTVWLLIGSHSLLLQKAEQYSQTEIFRASSQPRGWLFAGKIRILTRFPR